MSLLHHLSSSSKQQLLSTGQDQIIASETGKNAPERPHDVFSIMIISLQWPRGSVMAIEADATMQFRHCHSSFPREISRMVDATVGSQESDDQHLL